MYFIVQFKCIGPVQIPNFSVNAEILLDSSDLESFLVFLI